MKEFTDGLALMANTCNKYDEFSDEMVRCKSKFKQDLTIALDEKIPQFKALQNLKQLEIDNISRRSASE